MSIEENKRILQKATRLRGAEIGVGPSLFDHGRYEWYVLGSLVVGPAVVALLYSLLSGRLVATASGEPTFWRLWVCGLYGGIVASLAMTGHGRLHTRRLLAALVVVAPTFAAYVISTGNLWYILLGLIAVVFCFAVAFAMVAFMPVRFPLHVREPSDYAVWGHGALINLSVIFLIPFVWLVTSSLKSETHLFSKTPEWVPRGEYYRLENGKWWEVVHQEVVEFKELRKDEQGNVLKREPKRTKVQLVDRLGDPMMEQVFTVAAPKNAGQLDQGIMHDPLKKAFDEAGIELPKFAHLSPVVFGERWEIVVRDNLTYILKLKDGRLDVYSDGPSWRVVPSEQIVTKPWPTGRHYVKGVQGFNFLLFLQNTLFIVVFVIGGTLLSCSWVAFGFSILQWRGRDKVFYVMLATLMLPPQVTMIPLFVIFRNLGWINTYMPLIVPAFLGNAFFIFLIRQFFLTIPKDLIDAARVDGCSTFRIYWQIALPLSIPAMATVALFTFMLTWNDFMGPLVYVVDEAKYTLSLGLAMFKGRFASRYGEMMAVSVLLTIPIIVMFFFTQKTFIQGIKTSGMKG